ncbi:MAG: hypothetical protein ACSHYB_10110 [Roseibacillus sp.]
MNIGQKVIPVGALLFGLALGTLWSPREKDLTPEQITAALSRQASKSTHSSSRSGLSANNRSSTRSQGNPRNSSLYQELTVENLISTFKNLQDEEEINPMALARYAAQLTNMGEFEVTALLKELQGPFDEEDGAMQEVAESISIIVFSRLCELNGPEAMRMLHSGELGEDIDDVAILGMNAWVAADPEGARRWFQGAMLEVDKVILAGGEEEDLKGAASLLEETDIISAYLRGMTALDPDAVKESIASLQSDEIREHMQMELSEQLIEGANSKDQILSLLNDDTFKDFGHAQIELIAKLTQVDTDAAESWATTQPLSLNRDHMYASIANSLLQENPSEGAAWYQAQELSPDTSEAERLQRITNRWMVRDLEGAATWLLQQPNNPDRDYSESLLATRSAQNDEWEAAFRWNSDITDASTQEESLNRLLRQSWDRRSNSINQEAIQAAHASGHGHAIDAFLQSKDAAATGSSRLSGKSLPRE